MKTDSDISLVAGDFWAQKIPGNRRLACHRGRLLVTLNGYHEDFCLAAGEHVDFAAGGLLVVEALENGSGCRLFSAKPSVTACALTILRSLLRSLRSALFRKATLGRAAGGILEKTA